MQKILTLVKTCVIINKKGNRMEYCNLRGIHSSRVVMGCMRIADKPLQHTESLIVEAVRAGVNTFDLADIYGGGDCEKIFGVAIDKIKLEIYN